MINVENTQTIVNDSEKKIISFIIYFVGIIINAYLLDWYILNEFTLIISSCIFSIMIVNNFSNQNKFIITIIYLSISILSAFISIVLFFANFWSCC